MNRELYPFESHYLTLDGGIRLHYLDEGQGEPVVMLHGNPTWSFFYRKLILGLRDKYRCIVPDHIGMGLSDKPGLHDYPYSLERRVQDLEKLITHLGLDGNITLVVHDWGGMIGFAYAIRNPGMACKFVVMNSAAFILPAGKDLPKELKLARTPVVGSFLVRGLNMFVKGAIKRCVATRKLTPDEKAMYLMPYDSWGHRIAVDQFIKRIPMEPEDPDYNLVTEVERNLSSLRPFPMIIVWGMKDFIFDKEFLSQWQRRFPSASFYRIADAGHFLLEDKADDVLPVVRVFLEQGSG